jgi:hypothetical protein
VTGCHSNAETLENEQFCAPSGADGAPPDPREIKALQNESAPNGSAPQDARLAFAADLARHVATRFAAGDLAAAQLAGNTLTAVLAAAQPNSEAPRVVDLAAERAKRGGGGTSR